MKLPAAARYYRTGQINPTHVLALDTRHFLLDTAVRENSICSIDPILPFSGTPRIGHAMFPAEYGWHKGGGT